MHIPTWKSSKGISADHNSDSLPPNEGERLQAKFSEATAEAQSAAKRAAATAEKYIASLKLIGTALRDLSNRIITLERRSSEANETFENLRSSVKDLSQSWEHHRVTANESIEQFDQRLTIVANDAVALNRKISDLAAGKDEAISAVDAIHSDNQTKADNAQSQPHAGMDSVAGLLSSLQAGVNELIERIENLERRITKLEPRETAVSEAAIEEPPDDVPSRSDNRIADKTESAVDVVGWSKAAETPVLANEEPLAAKDSPVVPNIEGQEASQFGQSRDAEPGRTEPDLGSEGHDFSANEEPLAAKVDSPVVLNIEEQEASQFGQSRDAEPSRAEPDLGSEGHDFSANEEPLAAKVDSPVVLNIEEQEASQFGQSRDAEPGRTEPDLGSEGHDFSANEEPLAAKVDSPVVLNIEEQEASQFGQSRDAEPGRTEPALDSDSYDAWNRALCGYFFSERSAKQPVYLDPEETVLAEICRAQRWKLNDPKAVLVGAVRQTIDLTRSNPLAVHVRNAELWNRGKRISDPPFVGLLAVFSIAAAAMVASEDYAAHNYYDRLCELLHVVSPEDKHAIQTGYRECAEELWHSLNTWLDDWDGDRGRPTARSLDRRRYVSLAISQALVREHDRLQLRKMFSFYDLAPGQAVGLLQMRQVLQHWFSSGHHVSLARLWRRGEEFQDRISEIACAELNSWHGLSGDPQVDSSRPRAISVFAELRWHPVPSIDLSLVVPRLESESPSPSRFLLSDQADKAGRAAIELTKGEVRLEPSGYDDLLILEPRQRIRIGDALLASLDLAPEGGHGQHLIHSGQPLLTLAYSDRYGAFREVANPQLLERLVVLSHQIIRDRVAQHLQAAARPGFKEFDRSRLRGLPEGWAAFVDVEIVARNRKRWTRGAYASVRLATACLRWRRPWARHLASSCSSGNKGCGIQCWGA